MTSLTVFLTLLILFLVGGEVTRDLHLRCWWVLSPVVTPRFLLRHRSWSTSRRTGHWVELIPVKQIQRNRLKRNLPWPNKLTQYSNDILKFGSPEWLRLRMSPYTSPQMLQAFSLNADPLSRPRVRCFPQAASKVLSRTGHPVI